MNLQQVFRLSFISIFAIILSSCGDSDDYVTTSSSADAQIYGFKLNCIANTSADSINYPIMAKTKFVIDQFSQSIYNPDSLPYGTTLKKFATTIAFNASGVSQVKLQYKDSISIWSSSSDSIDFSIPSYPKFIITAPSGKQTTYTVDIRVHQIDPDLLVWENVSNSGLIKQPTTIAKEKTLLKDNNFHTFSLDTDGKLYLHKAVKGATYTQRTALSGLPEAGKFDLQSIILFNDTFFAVDSDKKGYISEDGVNWTKKSSNIKSVLGILPTKKEETDILLIITEKEGKYSLATTTNFEEIETVRELNETEEKQLPVSGFSSANNFDRKNTDKNLLMLTGGTSSTGAKLKQTWLVQLANDNTVRLIPGSEYSFSSGNGTASFVYNNYLYAITAVNLYRSISYGSRWGIAPDSEALNLNMPKASNRSVIVDEDNYIWVFGGIQSNAPIHEVWRGRLNKLNPKK